MKRVGVPSKLQQLWRRQPSDDEARLVIGLRSGDPTAVQQWFAQYAPVVTRFIASKVSNPCDAEELTQEVFINGLKSINLFRGGSSLQTWLVSIARHEVADYYRKKYAKRALQTVPLLDEVVSHRPSRSIQEVQEAVTEVLRQLSPLRQRLLVAKYCEGLSVKAIAAELEMTSKAVESELYRARGEFEQVYAALA